VHGADHVIQPAVLAVVECRKLTRNDTKSRFQSGLEQAPPLRRIVD
jgi:hypothetical protein